MPDPHPIQILARKAAFARLNLAQATHLFKTMYLADAVNRSHGNITQAAKDAGISREMIHRHIRPPRAKNKSGEDE